MVLLYFSFLKGCPGVISFVLAPLLEELLGLLNVQKDIML